MKFKSPFELSSNRYYCRSGSRTKVTYDPQIIDGNIELVESGKIDTYAEIQSFKDSTDINAIYKRFTDGDVTALQRRQAIYGDFSKMPNSFADIQNLLVKGESDFNKLPLEVKQKFDNSYYKFVASAGSKEWAEKLGMLKNATIPPEYPPVVNPPVENNNEGEGK